VREHAYPSLVYRVIKGKCTKCHHCHHKSNSAPFPRGKWCLEREKTSERRQQLIIRGDPQNPRNPLSTKNPNFLDGLNKCGYCFLTFSLNSKIRIHCQFLKLTVGDLEMKCSSRNKIMPTTLLFSQKGNHTSAKVMVDGRSQPAQRL